MSEQPLAEGTAGTGTRDVGAALRRAREARGASIDDCATSLRARAEQVRDLEAGRLDRFGGEVYARGFLRSYALLLGLDPAPLLAAVGPGPGSRLLDQLRTLPTEARAPGRRTPIWAVGLVVLVAAGGLLAVVLSLGGARTPPSAVPLPAPPTSAPSPAAPTPTPAPAPVPAPVPVPAAPVVLVLTFEAASWLEVVADGAAVEPGRTVRGGETLRIEARSIVAVRYGNAGGVRAELNGEDLGPQGRSGQVVRIAYGPDGVLETPTEAAPAP